MFILVYEMYLCMYVVERKADWVYQKYVRLSMPSDKTQTNKIETKLWFARNSFR